ncbi:MAG TPA: amidase [Steroidobacteraceae bacterium]|jgi:amidase|nr:amidase [Steroidobacteraceae bacterium]
MRPVAWLTICAGLCNLAWSAEAPEAKTIEKLQRDMTAGHLSSEALVKGYLARVNALDRHGPALHAVLAVNPDAIAQAHALDRERHEHRVRGPLHGIPLLIKDNIETRDHMPTTAGSLALTSNFASEDAPIIAALRAAGAMILGKTNLSEWANFRSNHSTSGWSAVGGLTRNPHVLDRTACGSSSGTAVAIAAGLAPGGLGTETDGSVTCPASMNGIVGLKPTLGLLSQRGIVPISHSQDTAGPMASNVRGVAMLLTAMAGNAGGCTAIAALPAPPTGCGKLDYTAALDANALRDKRIGVLRFEAASHPEMEIVFERALDRLRAAGATLIEAKAPESAPLSAAEQKVLLPEFKANLNSYLTRTPSGIKTRTLEQLIAFNRDSPYELQFFGQDVFTQANETTGLEDPKYRAALADSRRLSREQGIDRLLGGEHLDLLVAPTTTAAWRVDVVNGDPNADSYTTLAAVAGYPHLSVPMGTVQGLPVGMSFIGAAWSERLLLACGFAFEQRRGALPAPLFRATVETNELFSPRSH